MSKSKTFKETVHRSAITGRFVSSKYAGKHPKTTIKQVLKIKKVSHKK